jgi:hypothetical protein
MPSLHRVVTINVNHKYPFSKSPRHRQLREILDLHGPQFRIPVDGNVELPDAHHAMHPDAKIIPVCAIRDNWVAFFYSDEIILD